MMPWSDCKRILFPSSAPAASMPSDQNCCIWPLVIADMQARDRFGRQKYGRPLTAHNGRDALQDAYEEALDLAVYLKQAIVERSGVADS